MRAQAYWTVGRGQGELRAESLPPPGEGEALVRALCSGVSRGTELLVHRGEIPETVADRMRAPFQAGDFPWPVKYGYLSVGEVEAGPTDLVGRRVFCLYPHQDRYVVPVAALSLLPDDVPSHRAVLTGTLETALNAVWEASPRYGDRVAVVGLGMVGASIAGLLAAFPLQRLQVVDADETKAVLAGRWGLEFVTPAEAAADCDVVVHASASEEGLATALRLAGDDAEVVEVSWFGSRAPRVALGADFHARRLTVRASQVGAVSGSRRARRSLLERRGAALQALRDDRFDALLGEVRDFAELPELMQAIAAGRASALCHVVSYPDVPVPSPVCAERGRHHVQPDRA